MSWFKPTILSVLEERLYLNERQLIEARGKAAHAKQLARQADVNVACLQDHINELRLEIGRARGAAPKAMSGMDPLHPANHGGG